MKRLVSALTAVALSAVLTAGAAASPALAVHDVGSPSPHADTLEVPSNRPVYLALGDSLAAGQAAIEPTGTFENTVRQWKARGFVAQFHDTLRDRLDCRADRPRGAAREGCPRLQVVNIARTGIPGVPGSGVTTQTLLTPGDQLDQAVALIAERNTDASPRNDVEAISLTVGGNDLYGPAVAACIPLTEACTGTLAATFAGFAARYEQILATLRAAAGDDVLIVTTTYYNPLPYCALGAANPAAGPLGDLILEGGPLPGGGELTTGFNDLIRGISARYGATVADTFGQLGAGDFVGGTDCTHPNAAGHAAVADVFAAAVPR